MVILYFLENSELKSKYNDLFEQELKWLLRVLLSYLSKIKKKIKLKLYQLQIYIERCFDLKNTICKVVLVDNILNLNFKVGKGGYIYKY